jgi:hypothetical protein
MIRSVPQNWMNWQTLNTIPHDEREKAAGSLSCGFYDMLFYCCTAFCPLLISGSHLHYMILINVCSKSRKARKSAAPE